MNHPTAITRIKMAYHRMRIRLLSAIFGYCPKVRAEMMFLHYFRRRINWEHPTELIEKIRWVQFKSDISIWTILADKCQAREYVASKGLADILIPIYGIWENASDIDFNTLPESFVIKPNNGSGDAIIITDKSKCDTADIRRRLDRSLRTRYGLNSAETHYAAIKPMILAEKLLAADQTFSSSMVDYKFFCADGEPLLCLVYYNRGNMATHEMHYAAFDTGWNKHDEWLRPTDKFRPADVPRPEKLEECLRICRILSKGLPFVRVDLYISGDNIYFGEFTFTPNALKPANLSKEARDIIASRINL